MIQVLVHAMLKRILISLTLLGLISAQPVMARPTPWTWTQTWQVIQQPVEQESPDFCDPTTNQCSGARCTISGTDTCVYNPTNCGWDSDDSEQWQGFGTVVKNESHSLSWCVIADGYDGAGGDQHRIQARIFSQTPDVTISFTNDYGVSYPQPVPILSGKNFIWLYCERDITDQGKPISYYPVIPNSNGGTGEIVNYTLNVTTGAIKGSASLQVNTSAGNSGPNDLGCPVNY